MADREKLVEVINEYFGCDAAYFDVDPWEMAHHLITHGLAVREKGEWTEHQHTSHDDMREENVIWFTYSCSLCGGEVMSDYDFCPNCGADMRKGENDGKVH